MKRVDVGPGRVTQPKKIEARRVAEPKPTCNDQGVRGVGAG